NYDHNLRHLASGISSLNSSVAYIQFLSQWSERPAPGGTPNLRLDYQSVQTGGIGNNGSPNMAILGPGLQPLPGGTSSTPASTFSLVIIRIDYLADTTSMWLNPNVAT